MPARSTAAALATCLLACVAGPARALSIDPAALPFSDTFPTGRLWGTLEVLGIQQDLPAGAVVAGGSLAGDDFVILLRASITDDSTAGLLLLFFGIERPDVPPIGDPISPTAAGFLAGPGDDVAFGSLAGGPSSLRVDFPTHLVGGDHTSDVFFVAFPDLAPGDEVILGALLVSGFERVTTVREVGTVVPEPGSGSLLALGLLAVAGSRRRGRCA